MKRFFFITLLMLTVTVQAATKVKIKHYDLNDGVIVLNSLEPLDSAYEFVQSVSIDWPVSINGKPSKNLMKLLFNSVIGDDEKNKVFPDSLCEADKLADYVRNNVYHKLRDSTYYMELYINHEDSLVIYKDVDALFFWNEELNLRFSHVLGDIVFFVETFYCYYGGPHPTDQTKYYAFDAALDRPVRVKDIVTDSKKMLLLFHRYDNNHHGKNFWSDIDDVDLENFFIRNGKIVFVFPTYSIGSYAEGETRVSIPLKVLRAKRLLTPYGKRIK